jgi:hypothetical protein
MRTTKVEIAMNSQSKQHDSKNQSKGQPGKTEQPKQQEQQASPGRSGNSKDASGTKPQDRQGSGNVDRK